DALGVRLLTVPIEQPFQGFVEALAPHFEGREPDTTEENLQSRTRGALLMALANKFGGLLLTTGNKSEYAVGYATIYGDMCGGYAPIKDLYKTEVYGLAKWRNTVGGAPVIPPAVIARPPSAELRDNQLDQDSLPPYDVLDAILRRYVDLEQSREELTGAGFDPATVERVLRLVRTAEWKRHQAAPGPKVSRRGFGGDRRYPVSKRHPAGARPRETRTPPGGGVRRGLARAGSVPALAAVVVVDRGTLAGERIDLADRPRAVRPVAGEVRMAGFVVLEHAARIRGQGLAAQAGVGRGQHRHRVVLLFALPVGLAQALGALDGGHQRIATRDVQRDLDLVPGEHVAQHGHALARVVGVAAVGVAVDQGVEVGERLVGRGQVEIGRAHV